MGSREGRGGRVGGMGEGEEDRQVKGGEKMGKERRVAGRGRGSRNVEADILLDVAKGVNSAHRKKGGGWNGTKIDKGYVCTGGCGDGEKV